MAIPNLMKGKLLLLPPAATSTYGTALVSVSVLLLLLLYGLTPAFAIKTCRYLPHSDCWPSPDTWRQLNDSIGGHLLAPTPPALPCYIAIDSPACRATIQNWTNAFWRADQPGAMQSTNLEAFGDKSCFLPNPNSTSSTRTGERGCCFQGAVPPYAVEAHEAAHVQAAIRFAAIHNLRLSIKSTGHDLMGRSTAPGSLNIWMHRLKHITFHDDDDAPFVPAGCPINSAAYSAVTVGAGTQWQELYEAADEKNVVVVGAMSASVSVSGGYLQGGGHSPLSPLLGLAADQVLEMSVVTADGQLRRASSCQNADLFWALRGGGGGTYGAVVSSTLKTFPALQGLIGVSMQLFSPSASRFQELLAVFVQMQASMVEDAWAGYSFISTVTGGEGEGVGFALSFGYVLPNVSASALGRAEAFFAPLYACIRRYPEELFLLNSTARPYSSFQEWHTSVLCSVNPGVCTDPTGTNAAVASRLLPEALLLLRAPDVAAALMEIVSAPEIDLVVGHLVGGGAVTRVGTAFDSINPAWCTAIWHVVLVSSWQNPEAAPTSFESVTRMNRLLIGLSPGSGSYLNEADVNEPDWQWSFFGSHYGPLKAIKDLYDPRGLFTCVNCVGSEDWLGGDNLNCRDLSNLDSPAPP